MPETQNIEYKSIWKDKYLQWLCGFANVQGGTLVIGKDAIHINVNMKILTDNRASFKGNRVLFKSPRALIIKEIDVCINAEKHYHKDTG